ncbi:MAG TPA: elongation factor G [Acidobacteriaceae bacterium]|jgi:elongation factor G|nr:elongation factor G [Acidobacteriaceae bacterium]
MKIYKSRDIRNVAVVGHSHCGKTTLLEALLATAGAIPAMGSVNDGTAVTAYDEEESARQMTLSNGVAYCEWNGAKINLIDTPGFNIFLHEARAAMLPVESAMVVVDAVRGVEPMTQRVWSYAQEFNLPRVVVVNRLDRENADPLGVLDRLQSSFGRQVVPIQLPIGTEREFRGVINLVSMQAFEYTAAGNGRGKQIPIPSDLADQAQSAHEALVELVAEGKDELMEEFFAKGTIPEEDLIPALHEAIREDRIFPVIFVGGQNNIGCDRLLEFLRVYAPAPSEREPVAAAVAAQAVAAGNGHANGHAVASSGQTEWPVEMVTRPIADEEPLALFVFKTISDPFAGQISFFKVFSGCAHNDDTVMNHKQHATEKLSHLSVMQGKNAIAIGELHAGDIGAVPKLKNTHTGDTLGDKNHALFYEPVSQPEPAIAFAIEARTRADEDKLANGLHRIMEEDTLVRFYRDPQTQEFLIAGTGQQHIEVVVSKLRRRYHTEVTLKAPKVPYRETIRARAEGHGRHKKQSGGHGQFGDCKIRMEPLERGSGFEFVNQIYGGAIPRNYIPAVEKGVRDTAERGFLAGYPVVDFRATVFDGSYHDVDSNEISFRIAGRLAFRQCMEQARPALLEPIMRVDIQTPETFAGSVMGDLNSRRGRVLGMDPDGNGETVIHAEAPMAEMLTYGVDLTAMTQGQGSFHMEADHYDYVPAQLQEKIVTAARSNQHADTEDEE